MKILPVAAIVAAIGVSPALVLAAGQPNLDSQAAAAATDGKPPAQAEKSKMHVKQTRDTQKYHKSATRGSGKQTTGSDYETKGALDGASGKSSGNAATAESGGKKPPP